MDWPRDDFGMNEKDLSVVFRYAPRDSTIVQILRGNKYNIEVSSLESDEQWSDWLDKDLPKLGGQDAGLVLILAKRPGEVAFPPVRRAPSDEWVKLITDHMAAKRGGAAPGGGNAEAFAALGASGPDTGGAEKRAAAVASHETTAAGGKRPTRRGVRTLPFSAETFKRVAAGMHTHGSIARIISRSDVPVFSADRVEMDGRTAWVYSCRSSNAWDFDLALSVTYFPDCGLVFAVVYGCYLSACTEILKRLALVRGADAAHPLLLPGIFAELERGRHMALVRATISNVESRIFELDALQQQSEQRRLGGAAAREADRENVGKRNAWLDTTYLRNGLVSWNAQLAKMARHAAGMDPVVGRFEAASCRSRETTPAPGAVGLGAKIQGRVQAIREEYDDWTRDCTMRVDGMAMATQWAQGEINVEIAFDTKRDSQHMRSIALLTMVFLPGTFLASIFSMTFFDWKDEATVSSYIWIYFVIAIFLTLLTVGVWYYWIVYRPSRRRTWDDEDDDDDDESLPLTQAAAKQRPFFSCFRN